MKETDGHEKGSDNQMIFERGYFTQFSKIEKLYKKYFQEAVADYHFTPNEVAVLMFLYNNAPDLDTARDIVRFKGISKGLVARSVDSLCKKGYLAASKDERDRRIVHLRLSSLSDDIASRFQAGQKVFSARLEQGIPEEHLRITQETVALLGKNIENLLKGDETL